MYNLASREAYSVRELNVWQLMLKWPEVLLNEALGWVIEYPVKGNPDLQVSFLVPNSDISRLRF
jgi:hypothetical protein